MLKVIANQIVGHRRRAGQTLRVVLAVVICAPVIFGQASDQEFDIRPLPVGGMVEREINRGEHHIYLVEMQAGQVLRLKSSGAKANLYIWLGSYADERVMDAKAFSALGRASLTFIPEKTGRYIVFVKAIRFTSIKARYQLTASVDTATVEDQERVRAEGLLAESTLLIIPGDAESLRGAMQKLEESLEFWARTKESHWESITRGILGLQYAEAGEFGKAWEHLNRGLLLCQTAGDLHCEAAMLNNLGLVYLSLGDTEKAVAYLERVRTLMTNLGDANGIVWSTSHLGLALIDTGKPQRALELFKETLPIIEELGNPDDKASIFGNMGKAYAALSD
jgi:tetratricopeptide (TPR) repeat protein